MCSTKFTTGCVLQTYQNQYNRAITELFYKAVYNIDERVYNSQQKQAWAPYPIDYKQWANRLADTQPYLLFKNNKLIGFIEFINRGYIDCLYIHPDFQQQGYATQLIEHVVNIAQKESIKQISVNASLIAKGLFQQFGFITLKENKVMRNGVSLINFSMQLQVTNKAL